VVIGAGLSGLACAFRLRQLGVQALVLEASRQPGGFLSTIRRNGFVFEAGPQFPRFPESVWTLVRQLGLENEFVPGDPKAKRYILRAGRLHLAPFSPGGLLTTRLIGLQSKVQLLSEALRCSYPPDKEESLAGFVERKFGVEVLNYLVDPFVSTIFFGDTQKMGMESAFPALVEWERTHGSVVRGALHAYRLSRSRHPSDTESSRAGSTAKRQRFHVTEALPSMGSFRRGMGTLTASLAEQLGDSLRLGARVESIVEIPGRNGSGEREWSIRLCGGEEITSEAVSLALPAYVAASLLEQTAPKLSALLAAIEHPPMSVVSCGYQRKQVRHATEGFGFLVPRQEGLQTICTFWNSSLFPAHAPEGTVLMTSFAGWERGGLTATPVEALAQIVERENGRILGITGSPIEREIWKYQRGLPQYNVGHAQRVKEIREALEGLPGLCLAGNFLAGRSIGECTESGFHAADRMQSNLRG
jgi:protoporphyrinogen/coproporphyrinogen III oxidase